MLYLLANSKRDRQRYYRIDNPPHDWYLVLVTLPLGLAVRTLVRWMVGHIQNVVDQVCLSVEHSVGNFPHHVLDRVEAALKYEKFLNPERGGVIYGSFSPFLSLLPLFHAAKSQPK